MELNGQAERDYDTVGEAMAAYAVQHGITLETVDMVPKCGHPEISHPEILARKDCEIVSVRYIDFFIWRWG